MVDFSESGWRNDQLKYVEHARRETNLEGGGSLVGSGHAAVVGHDDREVVKKSSESWVECLSGRELVVFRKFSECPYIPA